MREIYKSMIASRYFTYFCIVVAAMLLLMIPIYAIAYSTFYNNALRQLENRLEYAGDKLEETCLSICALNSDMQSNELHFLKCKTDDRVDGKTAFSALTVWKQLKQKTEQIDCVKSIYLSYRNNEVMITPESVTYYGSVRPPMDKYRLFTGEYISFSRLAEYEGEEAMVIVSNPANTNMAVSAVCTSETLRDLFESLPVYVFLYDLNGNARLCSDPAVGSVPAADLFTQEYRTISIDGDRCTAMGRHIRSAGLIMGIALPSGYIAQTVRPILLIMVGGFVLMAAAGIGLALFMAAYSTRPIRRLVWEEIRDTNSAKRVNELRYLLELRDNYSSSLKTQETRMQGMMDTVREVLRENYFLHLLNGAAAARDDEVTVRDVLPELCKQYRIALIRIREEGDRVLPGVRNTLMRLGFLAVHTGSGRLAVCVPEKDAEGFRKTVDVIADEISQRAEIRTALSERRTELFGVRDAYRSLLEEAAPGRNLLTLNGLRDLESSFRSGDTAHVRELLEGWKLPDTDVGLREAFGQLRSLMRSVWPAETLPFWEESQDAVVQMGQLEARSLVLTESSARTLNARGGYKKQVLAYIGKNISDPDLCVDRVAARFDISGRQVYGIVKEALGLSFTEYVLQLRMEHAAQLLSAQIGTVQEVALACGYTSLNTFHKAFRRYYGFPPGQYSRTGALAAGSGE